MQKNEAKAHSKFMKWIKHHKNELPQSFLMESKVVRLGQTRFPYRELSEKEERLLLKAKNGALIQTHSDISMLGTNCDGSVVSGGGLIFLQWVRRGNKKFYIIDIESFISQRDSSSSKSLCEGEAEAIALISGVLS